MLSFRLKLCMILSVLKSSFVLPESEELLQKCEGIVRNLMENETNPHSNCQLNEVRNKRWGEYVFEKE